MKYKDIFSSFSVDDIQKAKEFYGETLGLEVKELKDMGIEVHGPTGIAIFLYPKGDQHVPATFTVLNFVVDNIDEAVEEFNAKGITFEQYDFMQTDEKGISRQEKHSMAWFKDPAGNILSVLTEEK